MGWREDVLRLDRSAAEGIGAFALHWVTRAQRTVRWTARWGGRRRQGALDGDLSLEGLLAGLGGRTARGPGAA